VTVAAPPCAGPGCWAGAPSVTRDGDTVYLSYRLRRPDRRGFVTRVAASHDGLLFRDLWQVTREELGALSLERSALVQHDGRWRLYLSFVDQDDRRWRIAVCEASRPDAFLPRSRRDVLTASDAACAGVKDPLVFRQSGAWHMLFSVALPQAAEARLHEQGDAFASGGVRSATGHASSGDGLSWRFEGVVLAPEPGGWDAYETRISCLLPGGLALYDGCASVEENYEERTGVAASSDGERWRRLTRDAPALASPEGTRALRYVCVVGSGETAMAYFEASRADGAHELRACPLSPLAR
jgi:hypothetical protein